MPLTKQEQNKKYYEAHKDSHNARMKEYYKTTSSLLKTYCDCCKCNVFTNKMDKHNLTKKHINNLAKISIE